VARNRTRYRHAFSGLKPTTMPEPNRPPWRIAEGLGGVAIWRLVERNVTLVITCDACPHFAKRASADLERRFRRQRGRTLAWIAPKLRCSRCRSEWLRISTEHSSLVGGRPDDRGA
jgi:hypothetical protein